jgi:catechol 2,3-dioxygenase-like lactoylglutathione lyase family enzyme
MIESISHITLIAKDVERMAEFLKVAFDAEEIYDSKGKNYSLSYEKFFRIGGTWVVVMEGAPLPQRSYNHIAFKVPDAQFDDYAARIKKLGVEIRPGRERMSGETRSIYFYVTTTIFSRSIRGPWRIDWLLISGFDRYAEFKRREQIR